MQWLYKKFIRKILFLFDAELAHKIALDSLSLLHKLKLLPWFFETKKYPSSTVLQIANLGFKNKLGIAAGLDKNGDYISALAELGPAFIELGTVTPRPQPGNPKPRLFRLVQEEAIINRMGFNNLGIDNLIKNVEDYKTSRRDNSVVIGINIGKNFDTPIDSAVDDYLICFRKAYLIADYISINISSPNTANLRDLQQVDYLNNLLFKLKAEQTLLETKHKKYTPVALKIAPDLQELDVKEVCELCLQHEIDIIIVANTTIEHELLFNEQGEKIAGGLSGKPIFYKSNAILKQVVQFTRNNAGHKIFVIGVGGISSAKDAVNKLNLGADLIQVYSGIVYNGPSLITEIVSKS